MTPKTGIAALAIAASAAAGGWGLYTLGLQRGMQMTATPAPGAARQAPQGAAAGGAATVDPSAWSVAQGEDATRRHLKEGLKAGDTDPVTGRRILHYHDPMVPGTKFEAPGKSPFMDMMLVPAYAGSDASDASSVTVSPRVQQNLGIRTAPVIEAALAPEVSAVGAIAFNERDQAVVQARAAGFVERVRVRATLDRVAAGAPIVELHVPDWLAAQEEFLSLRRMQGTELAPLVDAARQRMRLAGMSDEHIQLVESSGRTQPRLAIRTPIGGVVTELMVREGMTVAPGMTLARINGLATVWAEAEVPESQAALVRPGARVAVTTPAAPGAVFDGKVQALLPQVDPQTRTIKARMEIANRHGQLVPGMFVQMRLADTRAAKTLAVPSEAVIHTGRRAVVMVAEDGGRFRPVEVDVGLESGGQTQIKRGLQAGQRVVLSGQFLIDSEASLRGLEARLNAEPAGGAPAPAAALHRTEAVVEAIQGHAVTLTHPPIESLKWPGMTMDFRLPAAGQRPAKLAVGDRVRIEFRVRDSDVPQITAMTRAGAAGSASAAGTSSLPAAGGRQ